MMKAKQMSEIVILRTTANPTQREIDIINEELRLAEINKVIIASYRLRDKLMNAKGKQEWTKMIDEILNE
jgi:hypothetical protein